LEVEKLAFADWPNTPGAVLALIVVLVVTFA
jgi:hypothetical protein